jgi:hypothetical protein
MAQFVRDVSRITVAKVLLRTASSLMLILTDEKS